MIFRTDIKEIQRGDKRILSGDYNEGVRKLNAVGNFTFNAEDYQMIRWTGSQWILIPKRSKEFPFDKLAFGFSLNGDVVTIFPGTLRIHGTGLFPVAEIDVTLTGSVEFVFLAHSRDHNSTSITHSTTEPETTSNELRVPLYKFTADTPGLYELDRILNMGDINIDTPLRA